MKKLLSIIALMLLLSCSKSKPASGSSNANDFYIRFKANGTQLEYRANAEASYNKQTGANYITTLGGTKDQFIPNKSNMTVALTSVGVNETNITYTNYATVTAGSKKGKVLQLAFYDANGKFFMSWSDDFVLLLPAGTPFNGRLILTEATSLTLKGNFSGTMM
ncbi:MAG TPA: hypothetical protein VKA49_01535, partial [Flavitalea sp.]|nr:hypothetical protein [Flavitalea sp.]